MEVSVYLILISFAYCLQVFRLLFTGFMFTGFKRLDFFLTIGETLGIFNDDLFDVFHILTLRLL
jgi:hypothetical protein